MRYPPCIRAACLAGLLLGAGVTYAQEPLNLSTAKADVLRYVDSGEYARDLAGVAREIESWIVERAAQRKPGERLALVLDIDETTLSNLPHMRAQDFGYIPRMWDEWVAEGTADAIAPMLEVYRTARAHGVATFFLTARRDRDRPGTVRNLARVGYTGYEALICKPDDSKAGTRAFKTAERRRLESEGWTIIANVGDQQSDLDGGAAERAFKLPGPFYLIQ